MRAKNSAGWGSWSLSGRDTTDAPTPSLTAPDAPVAPTVSSGNQQLGVTWPASARATEYKVQRRTSTTSWTLASDWGSSRNRTLTGLTNGISYDIQVKARNGAGESRRWSATSTGTPRAPVKYQGTLTVGNRNGVRGYKPRQGLDLQIGSISRTAGTLTITRLTEQDIPFSNPVTTLTLSGSPPNSNSTFATLRVGSNTSLERTSASYASGGTWVWTSSIGLRTSGGTVTVTLQ